MAQGLFITLEGIEGVGKSTQARYLKELLEKTGREIIFTREPGGTDAGEAVREILLHTNTFHISHLAELLLIFSARAQHLEEVILPAKSQGKIVICDRFTDATYAYQGGGREIDKQQIRVLEALVQQGMKPDMTILLDAPVDIGLQRAKNRSEADRFESETIHFFERVRQEYLQLAVEEPERIHVIDAARTLEQVQGDIRSFLSSRNLC